jgi:hypothetical protein
VSLGVLGLMRCSTPFAMLCFLSPSGTQADAKHRDSCFTLRSTIEFSIVEDKGIEPSTLGLQSQCSPS